jgi:hypothetical protein
LVALLIITMIRQDSKKTRMNQLFDLFDANEGSIGSNDDDAFKWKGNTTRRQDSAYHSSNDSVDSSVTNTEGEGDEHNIREVPNQSKPVQRKQTTTTASTSNGDNNNEQQHSLTLSPPRPMVSRQQSVIDIPEGETFHLPHDNELRSEGVASRDSSSDDDSSDDDDDDDSSYRRKNKNGNNNDDELSDVIHPTDDAKTAYQKRNRQRRKLLKEIASKETTSVTIWRTTAYCVMILAGIFFIVGTSLNSDWHSKQMDIESVSFTHHFHV